MTCVISDKTRMTFCKLAACLSKVNMTRVLRATGLHLSQALSIANSDCELFESLDADVVDLSRLVDLYNLVKVINTETGLKSVFSYLSGNILRVKLATFMYLLHPFLMFM